MSESRAPTPIQLQLDKTAVTFETTAFTPTKTFWIVATGKTGIVDTNVVRVVTMSFVNVVRADRIESIVEHANAAKFVDNVWIGVNNKYSSCCSIGDALILGITSK